MGLLNKALALSERGSLLVHASMIKEQIYHSTQDFDGDTAGIQKKKGAFEDTESYSASGWLDLDDVSDEDTSKNKDKGPESFESGIRFNPSEALSSLLSCIHDTKTDLQAPAELFTIIREVFFIEKGSLLLLNHREQQFIGWAHQGYDKTTRHRLRLPYDIVNRFFSERNCAPILLEHPDTATLRHFFSIREYSILEKIYLLPFIYQDKIIGILLVTSSPILLESDESFFEPFKNVFTTIAKIIYHSREEKLNKLSQTEVKPKNLILQQITCLTEQAHHHETKVYFIVFNLKDLLETVQRDLENIDVYRMQEDIFQIITSMMPENDKIYFVDPYKLLVILSGRYHINDKLFVHQITIALRQLYTSLHGFTLDTYEIITYPDDASRPDEIIKLIFP